MKRGILLVLLLVGVLFSSCKKNYKCVCTTTTGTVEYSITEAKKKDATAACTTYKTQWSSALNGDCVLQDVPKQ